MLKELGFQKTAATSKWLGDIWEGLVGGGEAIGTKVKGLKTSWRSKHPVATPKAQARLDEKLQQAADIRTDNKGNRALANAGKDSTLGKKLMIGAGATAGLGVGALTLGAIYGKKRNSPYYPPQ